MYYKKNLNTSPVCVLQWNQTGLNYCRGSITTTESHTLIYHSEYSEESLYILKTLQILHSVQDDTDVFIVDVRISNLL